MTFSSDWFTGNIEVWTKHLSRFKGLPCIALELGSFEGRSAAWLLQTILTHELSRLICVDIEISDRLRANMAGLKRPPVLLASDAIAYLRGILNKFDIIYIDADHTARDVVMQAGLAWKQLKPGGVLIFDDYGNDSFTVKPAVDFFLAHWPDVTVLDMGYQAILQKPC